MAIDFNNLSLSTINEITDELSKSSTCLIEFHLSNVNSTQYHGDIASDFLAAMFICETIVSLCSHFDYELHEENWKFYIRFKVAPTEPVSFASKLLWLANGLCPSDEVTDTDFEQQVFEFVQNIRYNVKHCLDLADIYMANHVAGLHEWYSEDPEGVEAAFNEFPEYRFHFWKPFSIKQNDILMSNDAWIVPFNVDIHRLLNEYDGISKLGIAFTHALLVSLGEKQVVITNEIALAYPKREIEEAQHCAEYMLKPDYEADSWSLPDLQFAIEQDAEVLIASTPLYQIVIFAGRGEYGTAASLSQPNIKNILAAVFDAECKLKRLSGEEQLLNLDWKNLDDGQFEDLCYEILNRKHSPNFIRKMGKSRSRDGGRDIEYQISGRPGTYPQKQKWIVQCKLITNGSSLGSNRLNVSDTIDQYEASGYCVMTSTVIDPTLYDKLDAISKNRRITIEAYSRYELELFLSRHKDILNRYFIKRLVQVPSLFYRTRSRFLSNLCSMRYYVVSLRVKKSLASSWQYSPSNLLHP